MSSQQFGQNPSVPPQRPQVMNGGIPGQYNPKTAANFIQNPSGRPVSASAMPRPPTSASAMPRPPTSFNPPALTKPVIPQSLPSRPMKSNIPQGLPTSHQPSSAGIQMNGHRPSLPAPGMQSGSVNTPPTNTLPNSQPPMSATNGPLPHTVSAPLSRMRRPYPQQPSTATTLSTSQPHQQQQQQQYGYQQQQNLQTQMQRMQIQPTPQARPMHQQQQQPQMQQPQPQPPRNQYPRMPSNAYQNQPSTNDPNVLNKRLTVEQSPTYGLNLIEQRNIIPPQPVTPPTPPISQELQKKNTDPRTMRCTFNAIPQTSNLLKQSKLPFGVYIQPFMENTYSPNVLIVYKMSQTQGRHKELRQNIPVISSVITRCRACRSYLNPFIVLVDHRRWQCNMCYRINDIPEELTYDYTNRQYQDVRKRPELNYASVEFIAPSEYMLRPPQPSIFVFALDVSYNAIGTGYLRNTCDIIAKNLEKLPGDSRMMIGFITFNSSVHFYSLKASQSQPQMFLVSDLEDIYLPVPDGLLVNVKENKDMILQLLESLPSSFDKELDTKCATGAAMLAAKKLVSSIGGRITVFQSCLPNVGPGKLSMRESSNASSSGKDVANLNPTTDFYKKLALECAGEQIAIDLFILAGQYCDLASISGVSRYSSGAIYYFPDYHHTQNPALVEKFNHDFTRYLTRSIGFEAVMRLRCTKGMTINTFHGNFFVRSTDLLSLPNVNPDHSFGMQIDIEDNLTESSMVSFQAALLYTSTKGERRIRVHTLSLPVTSKLSDVYAYADQEAIVISLSKLASDRTLMSSLGDAREALMNACVDCLKSYKVDVANQRHSSALLSPYQLRLLPLNILAMMKNEAFKLGSSISLDRRLYSLLEFKWQPMADSLLKLYPRLYPIHDLLEPHDENYDGPPILSASAERLSRQGIYLMDNGRHLVLFVGRNISDEAIHMLFNLRTFSELPEKSIRLPELNNDFNVKTRKFIEKIRKQRTFFPTLDIIREDSKNRTLFLNNLLEDRTESSMSYHEFLQHVQRQING